MRALVTGGAGFIGSHIAERLLGEGHAVRIYDNFSSGKRANVDVLGAHPHLEVIEADVRDAAALERAAEGCDVVFHEAAVVSVPYSVAHPQETHDVNIQGTLNVLHAARARGVKRVVFACSAAIYGEEPTLPKRETMAPAPMSPYGVEKIAGEYYLQTWSKLYGVDTVSLRYFNVFGPRQDPTSAYSGVISIFVDRALKGEAPTIFGDGEQCRDFVYVDNVVDANLRAATAPAERVSGRAYNVACGERTTLKALLATIERIVGTQVGAKYAPGRAGDIKDSLADIARAREELGYSPKVGLEEGLRRLIEFVRSAS
jgi:nucleoside-diphosphate-sugar epimerase